MHIIVVGVDHTTAPLALREQLACSPCQIPQVLEAARRAVQESVLLSTCKRLCARASGLLDKVRAYYKEWSPAVHRKSSVMVL